ncbi:hypothetical protein CK203_076151 [Vitis vinifera]|uniref:Uncharacterized protein n=1 Tax=Vitis vinifera TaxID=29760 RepID=A0A438EEN3_VITVI|nr:hypothetical protein CK203_076151 [Vitis vinifera]
MFYDEGSLNDAKLALAARHDIACRASNLAPTETDVRMGRVSSVNLVSVGQGLAYQKRFEAIKEVMAAWQTKIFVVGSWPLWGMVKGETLEWATYRSYSTHHVKMASRGESGKSIKQLNVREFRERFCILGGISIRLLSGDLMSIEQEPDAIVFSKEHFNAGLQFSLSSLFKQFLHFTKILSAFLHPNVVRLVTGLPDSTKRATKGCVVVSGPWADPYEHLDHPFEPCHSLGILGKKRTEWNHETLLTKENLLKLVRDPKLYVVPSSLPRFGPRVSVSGEHYVMKDLSFY